MPRFPNHAVPPPCYRAPSLSKSVVLFLRIVRPGKGSREGIPENTRKSRAVAAPCDCLLVPGLCNAPAVLLGAVTAASKATERSSTASRRYKCVLVCYSMKKVLNRAREMLDSVRECKKCYESVRWCTAVLISPNRC